jgi:hypothetical protein
LNNDENHIFFIDLTDIRDVKHAAFFLNSCCLGL